MVESTRRREGLRQTATGPAFSRAEFSDSAMEGTMRPHARKTGVVVEEVEGEVLVYDLARNQGHCLGGITALVWRFANGQLTVEAILDRVRESSASDVTEDAVWSALESLFEAHLLVEPIAGPSLAFIQSHREMMRRIVQ